MLAAVSGRAGRGWLRRGAWAALVAVGVIGPLLARAAWEGRGALAQADVAAAAGRVDREILHLGRAARWRVPIAGHDEAALARLMAIGEAAELRGGAGSQTALMAYREARAALLATRAWGVADRALLHAANRRIARVMAEQELVFGTDLSRAGSREAYHRALLEQAGAGGWPWAAVAAGLTAAAALLALRGPATRGRAVWGGLALGLALATWALR